MIVLENKGYERIVGSPDAPFLNSLIGRGGLADAYHGVGRPSQPNYLALFSGSTQGVTDNDPHEYRRAHRGGPAGGGRADLA